MENEKEVQQDSWSRPWGASKRITGTSANIGNPYEKTVEEEKIDLKMSSIIFLGDCGVGKTSLQHYFREKRFSGKYNNTRGNVKYTVGTAAVTDTWKDVKDPENEKQYAARFEAMKMTDYSASETQTIELGVSLDQHFKYVFGLLCICQCIPFFPIELFSLKITGCLFASAFFSGKLPFGIKRAESAALSIFYTYACIESLYADSSMQKRIDNPDLLLEFLLGVLCCGLVVGFVLGYGSRSGTSLVFSFVCLKSQGSKFLPIVSDMLYKWVHDFNHALAMFLIISFILILCQENAKKNVMKLSLQVIISNVATALIYQLLTEEKYLKMYNHEQATVISLIWLGSAVGFYIFKKTTSYMYLMHKRFYIWLSGYMMAVISCCYFFCGLILEYMENNFHHYMIIFIACFSSAMLEYTAMVFGRSLAKLHDMPFYARRAIGFILGCAMVYFMKWTFIIRPGNFIFDQVLSVAIVLVYNTLQVKRVMEMGINLTVLRLAKSIYDNGLSGMRIAYKFELIDCGGQEECHYFNHLFIPKDVVCIIVFNFEEAKALKEAHKLYVQFIKLRYWLNSVLAHIDEDCKNHRPIFIVGTHRDSVDKEVRQTISQELTYCFEREGSDKYISCNKGTLIFEVENSGQCNRDEEGKNLRERISRTAVLKRQKINIKWLEFSKIMPDLSPIIKISELKNVVIEKGIVKDKSDFENFVKYHNERGDIYCCDSDSGDCRTGFVVLRHGESLFVDLFLDILNMLERKENKKGILNGSTLDQAIHSRVMSFPVCQKLKFEETKNFKHICRKLLEENHLIVKVPGSPYYLVPFHLKNASREDRDGLWKFFPGKEITFGLDFEEFEPKPIFWRLTSTLLKMSADINFMEKNFRQTVFSDFAVFTEPSTGIKYKLEIKSIISQKVILFTTGADPYLSAGAIEQQTFEVFNNLQKQLAHLCKTSFPGQKYSVGLVCQLQDKHTCLWEEKGHVHMYHLGDNKSGLELFDNIPNGISAVCKCGAAPKMKIYLQSGKKNQETERQFEKLRENWTKIEADLEPIYVLSYLFEKKVLDIDDINVIRIACASSRKEGCYELLKRVYKCSPEKNPIRHLCSAMREKYPHLADLLDPSSETTDDVYTAVKTVDSVRRSEKVGSDHSSVLSEESLQQDEFSVKTKGSIEKTCETFPRDPGVVTVFPAYKANEKHLPFIAVLVSIRFRGDRMMKYGGFIVNYFSWDMPDLEAQKALFSQEAEDNPIPTVKSVEIGQAIQKNSQRLFKNHKNLNIISASPVKVTGGQITCTPCIVLYCRTKGVVPLGDSLFPKIIEGIPVDVREGFVSLSMNNNQPKSGQNPIFYSDPLRMGCSIGLKGLRNFSGTLGMFVQHEGTTCFLTCSHVLGIPPPAIGTEVCQPSNTDQETNIHERQDIASRRKNRDCGVVKKVQFGDVRVKGDLCGIDAVLVKVNNRKIHGIPAGLVPQRLRDLDLEEHTLSFNDACLASFDDLTPRAGIVYKCGRQTRLTHGIVQFKDGSAYRPDTIHFKTIQGGVHQKTFSSMVEVCGPRTGDGAMFADCGDSGAAVFLLKDNKPHIVGMVVARTSYFSALISPIMPIFDLFSIKLARIEEDMETQ